MAEIRAHIPMAKKWWTGGETVRKRSSQTIGKTTPSSIDPFDEKGHARSPPLVIVHTFSPCYRHGSISLSLSWIARSIAARTSGFACSSIVDLRTRPGRTAKDKPLESVPSSRESGPRSRVVRELFVWRFEAGGIVGRERRSSISRRSVRRSSILLRADFREFGFLLWEEKKKPMLHRNFFPFKFEKIGLFQSMRK